MPGHGRLAVSAEPVGDAAPGALAWSVQVAAPSTRAAFLGI